jgi:hypothetical protein
VNDPDTHALHAHVDPRLLYDELPPFLVAGNRFGSYGFGAGLSGLLLALAPFGHAVAWILVVAAVVLGGMGYVRYAQGGATNRDASVVGLATGWIGFVVLLLELATSIPLPPEAYLYYPAP